MTKQTNILRNMFPQINDIFSNTAKSLEGYEIVPILSREKRSNVNSDNEILTCRKRCSFKSKPNKSHDSIHYEWHFREFMKE